MTWPIDMQMTPMVAAVPKDVPIKIDSMAFKRNVNR